MPKRQPETFDYEEIDESDGGRSLPPLPAQRGPGRPAGKPTDGGKGTAPQATVRAKRDHVAAGIETLQAYKSAFESRASNELDRVTLSTDSEYWVAICFESRAQKEAFLQRLKLADLGDKHIDGLEVAKRLGVPFAAEERVKWPKRRAFSALAQMASAADDTDEGADE